MCLKFVLEYFQVQVRFGEFWRLWSVWKCMTPQTRQEVSYGCKPFHGEIDLIFWEKLDI